MSFICLIMPRALASRRCAATTTMSEPRPIGSGVITPRPIRNGVAKPISARMLTGLLLLGAIGCGSKLYPARGTVTYADGNPVTEGFVVFESKDQEKPTTARGEIRSDGSFELGTFKPGDGAMPGKYRALVTPKFDPNAVDKPAKKPPIHPRYAEFKTSGLEFDVTAAGPNEFPIKVTR